MATVEQVYGKAAAMRLRTEKAVLEQFKVRLPWVVHGDERVSDGVMG